MPLPVQCEARSLFLKRYGRVDAFYFDRYFTSVSFCADVEKAMVAMCRVYHRWQTNIPIHSHGHSLVARGWRVKTLLHHT